MRIIESITWAGFLLVGLSGLTPSEFMDAVSAAVGAFGFALMIVED